MSKYSLRQLVQDVLPMDTVSGRQEEGSSENIYLLTVTTGILKEAGIGRGDTLVIERNNPPRSGNFVVAEIGSEMVIRQYVSDNGKQFLVVPGNHVSPLEVSGQFNFWGRVVYVMKRMI